MAQQCMMTKTCCTVGLGIAAGCLSVCTARRYDEVDKEGGHCGYSARYPSIQRTYVLLGGSTSGINRTELLCWLTPSATAVLRFFLHLSFECILWGWMKDEPWVVSSHPSAAFTGMTNALAMQYVQTVDRTGLWTSGTRGGRMLSVAGWLFVTWLASRRADVKPASHWSHTYGLGWVCDTKCC